MGRFALPGRVVQRTRFDGRATAKSQLSRLVKEALEGQDVVIASNGEPMVRLVPVASKCRPRGWGKLKKLAAAVDRAFTPEVDATVARSLERNS